MQLDDASFSSNKFSKTKTDCNSCFYNELEGIIYVFCVGDQNSTTVYELSEQSSFIVNKLKNQAKKIIVLADLTRLGKVSLSARRAGVDVIKRVSFDKVALLGQSFLNKYLINSIIIASGKGFQIRFFTNKEDAKRWLTQY